ncbi:Sodium/potassium/calcium exchanger 6-like protein [Dinothrombium tinctorium]|uniref:Sodium/potassium/calcium exchanger 6-like protein n=1 Tax=Dinothrombium tinctorium TaxID=1965070 RepID=A0A3S3P8Z6_9ACAR|nr:Sodium/potassium/calcium exchanger 6-like protein [Dinothrombium tinctorium]RWS07851.1 Sodium/potassium/calcium exchanger 6-like protein [Dinothrombium tinctorium]
MIAENGELYAEFLAVNSFVSNANRCVFLQSERNNGSVSEECFVDYMQLFYCYIGAENKFQISLLSIFWLFLLFTGLGVTADDFLCPSLLLISKTLRLSQNIAGVTFLAFGNGAPDIFSSLAGIRQARPDLVFGELFGAGIFVTTVVAGSIFASQEFSVMKRPLLRDKDCFDQVNTVENKQTISAEVNQKSTAIPINAGNSHLSQTNQASQSHSSQTNQASQSHKGSFSSAAYSEAGTSVYSSFVSTRQRIHSRHLLHHHLENAIYSITHTDISEHVEHSFDCNNAANSNRQSSSFDSLTTLLSIGSRLDSFSECKDFLIHICPIDLMEWKQSSFFSKLCQIWKAPIYFLLTITIPVVDYESHRHNWCRILNCIHCITGPLIILALTRKLNLFVGPVPVAVVVLVIGLIFAFAVFYTSRHEIPPSYHWLFGYLAFCVSVSWIYALANEVVSLLHAIGIIFDISDVILGLTVLAWGNSLGDLISNLSMARQGFPRMGISACFGGPLLRIPYTMILSEDGGFLKCRQVNYVATEERCDFVATTHDCHSESFVDYTKFLYCGFPPDDIAIGIGVCIVWVVLLFISLGVAATDFLCPALFVISESLHLSQNVAGVTLLAFGNGSPDIFAAIAGMRQGRPELVVGALFGGGTFVTAFVTGSIFACHPFKVLPIPFFRDAIFYLIATTWMCYTIAFPQAFHIYDALGFLALYLVYVLFVIASRFFDKSHQQQKKPEVAEGENEIVFEGIKPDDDPYAGMVVMKSFFYKRDVFRHDRPQPTLHSVPGIIPIIKVSPVNKCINQLKDLEQSDDLSVQSKKSASRVSINEDTVNSIYSTVSSNVYTDTYNRRSRASRASSIFSISQTQLLQMRRASKEFFEKISPIDLDGWKQQNWGGKSMEIIKAPIRFFLLLTTPMVDVEGKEEWNKFLSALHCITGPLFVLFAIGYGKTWIFDTVPVAVVVVSLAAIVSGIIIFTSTYETPPKYYKTYSSYLGFIVGVTWIYCISDEAVSVIRSLGIAFNWSEIVVGMTILAWGNCLLDFIANLSIARKGFPRMAIAACFGAPLMSLLFGVGIPTSLKLLRNPSGFIQLAPANLMFIIYAALVIGLCTTLLTLLVLRFNARREYGIVLITYYAGIIIISFLIEFNIINLPLIVVPNY